VFGKLARWKNRQLSLIGKSVIVSSQLLPIIMFTGSVMSMPVSMNQELSRGIYRFIWNGNDKEKRALTYQKLKNRGLGLPSLTAMLRSARADCTANNNSVRLLKKLQEFGSFNLLRNLPEFFQENLY
jgi:hypothetical protein